VRWKPPLVRARLSLGLVATFLGLLAVLHCLEPEFNSGHLINEYRLGSPTALAWVGVLSFLGSTVVFAGRAAGDPAMGLDPVLSITNRLMIVAYCLWFAVAA
jgi:hypothetical protein